MAEWKKFTGSEEQIKELSNAKHGWIIRTKDGSEHGCVGENIMLDRYLHDAEEYLICEPHRHAEMIKRWVDTGQPVYWFNESDEEWQLATPPVWRSSIEYSFNPPKEKQFIEVRDYLYKASGDDYWKGSVHKGKSPKQEALVNNVETMEGFIRWLDDDWRKIEI